MTAPQSRPTLKLLLIADSDSQLLACEALCSAPTTLNVDWSINVIPRDGTPQALLQRLSQHFTPLVRAVQERCPELKVEQHWGTAMSWQES